MSLLNPFSRKRRERLRALAFPAEWLEILSRNVPLYSRLTPEQQVRLREDIQVLLGEKHFEGCGGLEMTDEIRVTVAAHAALLMLGGEPHYYPRLTSVLVYPRAYVAPSRTGRGGVVTERRQVLLGESWSDGALVLAWDASLAGARDAQDGHNVILHEFAHQLDFEDGAADGAPYLDGRSQYAAWARALGPVYEELRGNPEGDVLDAYGTTNPQEFFAVATEAFFERPDELRGRHPELYAVLSRFYGLDLATTPGAPDAPSAEPRPGDGSRADS